MLDDICGREVMLNELRDYAAAGDEVGHGHVRNFDHPFGNGVGGRRDPVDDHEGIADKSSFHGSCAAGDYGGAGVVERGAGVVDEVDGEILALAGGEASDLGTLGNVERGCKRHDELEVRGGLGAGQQVRGGKHLRQVVRNLTWAAAGEHGDPGFGGVECVACGELFAGDGGQRQLSEGMADELGVDAALAVERLLEREDDQHAADVLLHQLDAVFLPGPQLRTDEENYRHAEAVELFGEPEVDLGEVD